MKPKEIARRWFLQQCGVGLGAVALTSLLGETGLAAPDTGPADPLAPKKPPLVPKAKRVIFLFMAGAPSHLELFDYKPQLAKFDGTLPPPDLLKGYRAAFINPNSKLLGPKFKFAKYGQSGAELSELLPHLAKAADNIAIVKSMVTDAFNHAPGQLLMNTGTMQFGRPSMGAWVTYGLGSESKDLPAFVVFSSGKKGPSGGNSCWGSGFLPTVYQGVQFRSSGDPVLYLSNPPGVDEALQRDTLNSIKSLNQVRLNVTGDPEIATRINSFEMAFRMQSSAPELMDVSQEPKPILEMYGAEPGKPSFANNCLLARRLVERGVRFVQLYHEAWDQHDHLVEDIQQNCKDTDQACAALLQDLKQRGMLDDTLVIWGGEFGRTPMVQGGSNGRDHHPNAFTMWLAGGGVKPGITIGESDDLGFNVTKDQVHVHDLHATILQLLGFDHTKLTYRFQGRDFRLTDVHGNVARQLLA
ncbi:MAG: sulfatase [Acidobacteria bacterium]|nr:MAG: sulfatase [Acidobacteriota bacterium]